MDLKEQVMAVLRESLHHHGQVPLPTGEPVLIGVADLRVSCVWTQDNPHPTAHIIAAELVVDSPGWDIALHEMVTGIGATVEEAIARLVIAWQHGQFEALRQAFGSPEVAPDTYIVVHDRASGHDGTWAVYESPLQLVGQAESLVEQIRKQPLVSRLGAALADQLDPTMPEIHWIKLFGARPQPDDIQTDSWFDNLDWPEGAAMLRGLTWPTDEKYHAVRQFLILRPVGDVAPTESIHADRVAPSMAAIAQAVAALKAQPDMGGEAWVAALTVQGMPQRLAQKLSIFLPLVAGRLLLAGLQVIPSANFAVRNTAGERIEFPLESEPVYRAVRWWFSSGQATETLSNGGYEMLALRSAEVDAVNSTLHGNVDIKGAKLSALLIEGMTPDDFETGSP